MRIEISATTAATTRAHTVETEAIVQASLSIMNRPDTRKRSTIRFPLSCTFPLSFAWFLQHHGVYDTSYRISEATPSTPG